MCQKCGELLPIFVAEELTLLANRFLSVHVFMVAKVGGPRASQNAEKLETAQIDEVQSIEVTSWKHFYEHVLLGFTTIYSCVDIVPKVFFFHCQGSFLPAYSWTWNHRGPDSTTNPPAPAADFQLWTWRLKFF